MSFNKLNYNAARKGVVSFYKTLVSQAIWAVFVSLGFLLSFSDLHAQVEQEPLSQSVSVESFWTNLPHTLKADFEVEVHWSELQRKRMSIANSVDVQHFTLKRDGDNFILFIDDAENADSRYVGEFNSVMWVLQPDQGGRSRVLVLHDPRLNPGNPVSNPSIAVDARQATIRLLVNFGISEMTPGAASWDPVGKNLLAQDVTPRHNKFTIHADYRSGALASVTYTKPDGAQIVIDYKYNPSFCGGRLPCAFTWSDHGPESGKHEYLTVRISRLEILASAISLDEFDPRFALKDKFNSIRFWSNNLSYQTYVKRGRHLKTGVTPNPANVVVKRVLTAEESLRLSDGLYKQSHPGFLSALRIALLIFAIIPIALLLMYKRKNKSSIVKET